MCLMRLPSKITSYKDSLLNKFPLLMKNIEKGGISIHELYEITKKYFDDVEQFIDALDYLYALNKIELDKESEKIINVI